MKHGSLFSGIGGFDLAAQWAGFENVFSCEIDPFCNKVLEKNFPGVKRYTDIRDFDGREYTGKIDIISGGFPCQPFSAAGKRKGINDNRFLWPEMLRVISTVRPTWVVGENVAGLVNMAQSNSESGLEGEADSCQEGETEAEANGILLGIITDLEGIGYAVQPFVIPACAVGAPHRRDRIWIVANSQVGNAGQFKISNTRREGAVASKNGVRLWNEFSGPDSNACNSKGARERIGQQERMERKVFCKTGRDESFNGAASSNSHAADSESHRRDSEAQSEHGSEEMGEQGRCGLGHCLDDAADTEGFHAQGCENGQGKIEPGGSDKRNAPDPCNQGLQRSERPRTHEQQRTIAHGSASECSGAWNEPWLEAATRLCRVDDVVPNRVDRLKSLGNAVVPVLVYEIFKAIKEIHETRAPHDH